MDYIRKSALVKPLVAHEQAEMLAKKRGGSAVEKFLVKPDYAYPNTRMNRDELRAEMNKPSAFFHDLRRNNNEIGLLKLEILQCIGLPRLDAVGENDAFCHAVCGSYAFQTDVSPPNQNPMWLSKMRRACMFPLYHAYARLYVGVFDYDGEVERDDFAGRVVLDVARMRPNCTYDVTLPLRKSAHVYMRRKHGAIRIRFHVSWYSERAAMLSYLPKGAPKFEPHESVTVNCCDKKSFQNVALTVHGTHPPGRFSMKLVKALVREINFTRIHVLRYLRKREIRNLVGWKNPIISGFVFCSWMHSVYANTTRYVPGNIITLLLLYLWKNYGNYAINGSLHRGFLPPTWEEMLMALIYGTDGRNCIQPLEMTLNEDMAPPNMIDGSASICCSGGCTVDKVAADFKKGVKVSTNRYRLRIYRQTFTGTEAVDFLVNSGYASSREEAVKIGRQLEEEKKLFEHVHRKQEFKDSRLFYHFLIRDDSNYAFRTHEPKGKRLLRLAGFLDENRSFAEHQLEMPYSNGNDHPRFSVKESLVVRSKGSKNIMEKIMAEDEDDNDAAELDMGESFDFDSSVDERRLNEFDSFFDLKSAPSSPIVPSEDLEEVLGDDEESTDDTIVTVKVLNKPPLQDIDYKPKSDKPIADMLAEARYKVHGLLLHCFNDRLYVVKNNEGKEQNASKAKKEPYASVSQRRKMKSDYKRNRWSNRTSEESLASIPENGGRKPLETRRIVSQKSSSGTNRSPSRRSTKSPAQATKEENDKLLKTGQYSNTNRWVAKLGVIVQPIVEIAYEWLYLFRALFNIFTWQDPILSFWISLIGPVVVVVLHFFPWRIVLGVTGLLLWGPQNWLVRVIRERKGISPPDVDKIIRTNKMQTEDAEMDLAEDPLFSNSTDENRPVDYSSFDRSDVRHIAVPYTPLLYNHRFYDWPPEPDYARVMKEDPLTKSIEEARLNDKESVRSRTTVLTGTSKAKNPWQKISAVARLSLGKSKRKEA